MENRKNIPFFFKAYYFKSVNRFEDLPCEYVGANSRLWSFGIFSPATHLLGMRSRLKPSLLSRANSLFPIWLNGRSLKLNIHIFQESLPFHSFLTFSLDSFIFTCNSFLENELDLDQTTDVWSLGQAGTVNNTFYFHTFENWMSAVILHMITPTFGHWLLLLLRHVTWSGNWQLTAEE